ncbi:MAG: hypothetical protein M4579_007306, partial [Chaenotheca gracillima]
RDDSASAEVTPGPTLTDTVGLFLLNKDVSSPASTYQVDVVAVHGLGGGAFKTWTDEKGNIWLRDLLIEDLPGARIFTYGYNSAFLFSRETSTLREYARALLEAIRSERTSPEERTRPLVFVCHSMGGIVVKQALIIARNESVLYPHLSASVSSVLFLGTPHQGSPSATYASILSQIANVFVIGSQMSRLTGPLRTELLQSLRRNENELLYIAQDFRVHTGPLMIASFIEQKNMRGFNERIVDESSGFMGLPNERIVPMPDCDHRELCKHGGKSNNYKKLLSAIKDGIQITQDDSQRTKVSEDRKTNDSITSLGRRGAPKAESLSSGEVEFLQSLSSEYRRQKDVNPSRVPGTCEWFLGDSRFHEWRDVVDSRFLHVYAGPGCGKSVLSKSLIDERLSVGSRTSAVLYFFFKNGQGEQDKCATAIAAMLHQLYTNFTGASMKTHALPKYRAHGANLSKMFDELWEIMVAAATDTNDGIVCIVDALDECQEDDRNRLMKAISTYYSTHESKGNMKFLVTSRPYRELDFDINPPTGRSTFIRFDGDDKSDLIASEINQVIEATVPHTIPKVPQTVQNAIVDHLRGMQNRTYLWLHLILDFIKKNIAGHGTERKLRQLLEKIPPGVDQAYEDMLSRSPDRHLTKRLLSIIIAARRPFSIAETKTAMSLMERDYEYVKDIEVESDEQFKDSIKGLCGLLLSVHDSKVYFIHETAREFLLRESDSVEDELSWKHSIQSVATEAVLAETCLLYLNLGDFNKPPWIDGPRRKRRFEAYYGKWIDDHMLLRYAANSWYQHYHLSQEQLHVHLSGWSIPESILEASRVWILMRELGYHIAQRDDTAQSLSSTYSLQTIARAIPDQMTDLDAQGHYLGVALLLASTGGHEQIVRLLLELGADANSVDSHSDQTALQVASQWGHVQIVRLLLHHGADANAQTSQYTALEVAKNIQIVRLLVEHGAQYTTQNIHITALLSASATGDEQIVRLLLERGAQFNTQDGLQRALRLGSTRGHEEIVRLLLKRGAECNVQGEEYTALWGASDGGHDQIVLFLLDSGADVIAQNDDHPALYIASRRGYEQIVQLLLERGADANAQDGDSTALWAASLGGHEQIVRLLLEHGADVSAQSNVGTTTALYAASGEGHQQIVRLLLEHGANVEAQVDGNTALQLATANGHEQIVRLLLEHGADLNPHIGDDYSPLCVASTLGNEQIVRTFLKHGADINAQNSDGSTALYTASDEGHEQIVRLLLEHGADVNIPITDEHMALWLASPAGYEVTVLFGYVFPRTALLVALREGQERIVRLLLEHGADVNARSAHDYTALWLASCEGYEQIVQLLLEYGADANAVANVHPRTAMQVASKRGHEQI